MRRALALIVIALAGCGNERTPPPDVATPAPPQGSRQVFLDRAGVRFRAPQNWDNVLRAGSLAGGVRSGSATVAVWHYRRSEPLPKTLAEMRKVMVLLSDRVKLRDPGFDLIRPTVTRDRIVLRGTDAIGDVQVGVRSLHLFAHGSEIVVDAYAPREHFSQVDEQVFKPLMRSVSVRKPRR